MEGQDKDCTRRRFLGGGVAGAVAGMVGCGGDGVASGHPGVDPTGPTRTTAGSSESGADDGGSTAMGGDGGGSVGSSGGLDIPPPNIVFITLDDVGWACLPAYGNPHIRTPAIDSLVDGGLLFGNAFLVTSSCSPSRGVFLTGQYPHMNGLTGLVHRHPELAIPPEHATLPKLLADAGYACGIQGKWHVSPEDPTRFGFHEFLNDITGTNKIESAEQANDFIRRHRDERFYLELDFVEPHMPWDAHEGLSLDPATIDVPDDWMMPNWPEIQQLAARYFVEIWYVDLVLAAVFATLDELGLAENTLIALASDNGAPFPGNKTTLYDRGIRTPLIMRWPGVIPAGVRSNAYASIVDLPQAFAIAATSQPAEFMQGDPAFFEVLRDPSRGYRDSVYAEMTYHKEYCPARAVRTDRWKYIRNLSPDPWGLGAQADTDWAHALLELPGHDWLDPRPPVELYDLHADPQEVDNLAEVADFADVRGEMHERLLEYAAATGDDDFDLDP